MPVHASVHSKPNRSALTRPPGLFAEPGGKQDWTSTYSCEKPPRSAMHQSISCVISTDSRSRVFSDYTVPRTVQQAEV